MTTSEENALQLISNSHKLGTCTQLQSEEILKRSDSKPVTKDRLGTYDTILVNAYSNKIITKVLGPKKMP